MPTIGQALALGLEHHQAGRFPHAEQIYRDVLRAQPDQADALHLLGTLAMQSGRHDEGLSLLERAVSARPGHTVYQANLGAAYTLAGRHAEARQALERAVRSDPANADAHYNLGTVLARLGALDEAAASYRRCLELRPGSRAALNNLGDVLRMQGELDEALARFDAALAAEPAPHVHYNRGLVLLSLGRLSEGWDEYEWRWQCDEFPRRHTSHPAWQGKSLIAQTLLVHAEQGLGDTIQFLRYLPQVRAQAERLLVEVPASLLPLCRAAGIEGLVDGAALPPFDVQCPMGSLPRLFSTTLENIPATVPYLSAGKPLVDAWRQALARYPGFRVGIAWQGRPTHPEDRYRSVPLAQFAPLAAIDGVRLVSLQKGAGTEQLTTLGGRFEVLEFAASVNPQADPMLDTAALIQSLDLVITVDTAVAHLAGALAAPVWVALRRGPDWRWLLARRDSPWYPTMRLFRQQRCGDWPGVFEELATELRPLSQRAAGRSGT